MIENIKTLTILFLLIAMGLWYCFHDCRDNVPVANIEAIRDTITVYKEKIDSEKATTVKLKSTVSVLKNKARGITYKTSFDSTATVYTVKHDLIKADLSNKIKDSIIVQEDKIIATDSAVINEEGKVDTLQNKETQAIQTENKALRKENKKVRRKLVVTKIVAVLAVILTILAMSKL